MSENEALPAIEVLVEQLIAQDFIGNLMDESPSLYERSLFAVAAHRKLIEPESALIQELDLILEDLTEFKKERI